MRTSAAHAATGADAQAAAHTTAIAATTLAFVRGHAARFEVFVRGAEVVGQVRRQGEPMDGRLLLQDLLRLRGGLRQRTTGADAGLLRHAA